MKSTNAYPDAESAAPVRSFFGRRLNRVVLTGAAAVGVAVGAAGLANAASSPSPTPSADRGSVQGRPAPDGWPGRGPGHGPRGGPGRFGFGGPRGGDGTISALSGSTMTLRLRDGASRSYTLTATTSYHRGPTTVNRAALALGEHVLARPTDPGASTLTAAVVDIIAPHIDGIVTDLGSGTLTVTDPDGFTRTIATTSSTVYTSRGVPSSLSAIKIGTAIHAIGTVDANHTTLDATNIDVVVPPTS